MHKATKEEQHLIDDYRLAAPRQRQLILKLVHESARLAMLNLSQEQAAATINQ